MPEQEQLYKSREIYTTNVIKQNSFDPNYGKEAPAELE